MTPVARVFIVEDEALIAMELADHLQQLGYEVCGRAAKADEALERIPAARPDVVLIDVNLGAGLSGLDVAERLGPSCGSAFIFLTAYSDPELVARAARTGSFAFLPKPFQIPVLAANIEMTLAARAWRARLLEANRQLDVSAEALQAKTNELERTHALLSAAFDASADGLVVIEAAGVRAANGRAREMWALPAEAGSDSALLTHIADQLVDPEAFVLTVEEVRLGRRASQSSMVPLRDGRVFQAAFRPQVVDSAIVGCVVSFSDITERERAQDALRESEDRYRTLFEHAPVGLAVADARGELVAVNAVLRGMGARRPR